MSHRPVVLSRESFHTYLSPEIDLSIFALRTERQLSMIPEKRRGGGVPLTGLLGVTRTVEARLVGGGLTPRRSRAAFSEFRAQVA